jgi:hypothetical protein
MKNNRFFEQGIQFLLKRCLEKKLKIDIFEYF